MQESTFNSNLSIEIIDGKHKKWYTMFILLLSSELLEKIVRRVDTEVLIGHSKMWLLYAFCITVLKNTKRRKSINE